MTKEEMAALEKELREKKAHESFAEVRSVNVDERSVEAYASFKSVDRQGEIILPQAFVGTLELFKKNPVVPWAHNYDTLPVAKATKLMVDENGLRFTPIFADHAFAEEVWGMYRDGFLSAFSVGFIPKAWQKPTEDEVKSYGQNIYRVIEDLELLEVSAVPIPANREALVTAAGRSIDFGDLKDLRAAFTEIGKSKSVSDAKALEDAATAKELADLLEYLQASIVDQALKQLADEAKALADKLTGGK